jgi:O-Antigen ligase
VAGLLGAALTTLALRGGSYDVLARGEAFLLAWWVLLLAGALGVLPAARPPRAVLAGAACLLALAAWIAVGFTWTESAERTGAEVARVLGLLGILLVVVLTVGPGGRVAASAALTAAAVLVCALAMTSRLAPDLLGNALAGYESTRLSFPLNYWNALGCWAAMASALALGWSVHAPAWPLRGLALGGTCVALPVAYLTYSRATTGVVVIGAVVVVALSAHRWLAAAHLLLAAGGAGMVILVVRAHPEIARGTGTRGAGAVAAALAFAVAASVAAAWITAAARLDRLALPARVARPALAAAGVVLVLGVALAGPALASRAWTSFQRGAAPAGSDPARRLTTLRSERSSIWHAALDAFRAEPLRGTGAGTFEFVWSRSPWRTHQVRDAHSLYLESLAELGLPGALLVVLGLGCLLVAALRGALRARAGPARGAAVGCAAAAVVYVVMAGVDWMWESTAVTAAALACAGVGAAGLARPADAPRVIARVPAVAIALVALVAQLPTFVATAQVRASQRAVRAQQVETALSAASAAVSAEPWGASGYVQRALVLQWLGQQRAAALDARRATRLEPTNWQDWYVLAGVEAQRRRFRAALRAAEQARRLNPRSPLFAR